MLRRQYCMVPIQPLNQLIWLYSARSTKVSLAGLNDRSIQTPPEFDFIDHFLCILLCAIYPFRISLYSTVITQPMSSYIDSAIQTSPADMDTVLLDMQKVSGSLGEFLQELFRHPS